MNKLPPTLYQTAAVRELDRIAIEEYGIPGITLMERAAVSVFATLYTHYPQTKSIAVFCGNGNNGGDGYLVATLALKVGWDVVVYAINLAHSTQDALTAYQCYIQAGGRVETNFLNTNQAVDVIVDAVLGVGLTRELSGIYATAVAFMNAQSYPVVAVDIPTGLNADTGKILGVAVQADITVSFIGLKQGMFTANGLNCCGKLVFADLEIPASVYTKVSPSATCLSSTLLPLPQRQRNSHKGNYGHVLVIGGDIGFSGAVRLAAEAALRTGAGLVSIATRTVHAPVLNIGCFELMCHAVETVADLEPLLTNATVIVLGTGLGQQTWGKALFDAVLTQQKPLVLDADALNLLAKSPQFKNNWILTPHPGEAARLLNCTTADITQDRFAAVKKIQQRYGGVCVLKGAGTLIFDGNDLSVSTVGNPGMATAGTGDVLAGIIGSLLAQGLELSLAAKTGVYAHGRAGDLAATQGERGLCASDLIPQLRQLLNKIN